jgi:O-antigen ligase
LWVGVVAGVFLASTVVTSFYIAVMVTVALGAIILTLFVRPVYYLITTWIVLTSVNWFLVSRIFPPEYYGIVGRGIFWGLLFCTIGAWAVENVFQKKKFMAFDNMAIKGVIIVFCLWGLVSLVGSLDHLRSIKLLSHIAIALIVSYMFYDIFAREVRNLKKFLNIVLTVAVVISTVTWVSAGYALVSGQTLYKQISLWFLNPNVLGSMLFRCIPILLVVGLYEIRNKGLRFGLMALMLGATFLSFHRTSWLATAVSVAFLLWKSRFKTSIWAFAVAALFSVGLLVPVVAEDTFDYVTGPRYTGRKDIWSAAWNTAREYPIGGTGPGNSTEVMAKYIETPYFIGVDTHSVYLRNAAEMGFPSLILLIAFYVVFFRSASKIERNLRSDYLKLATRGAIATFVGLVVHGFFENGFFLTPFVGGEFHTILPYILMVVPFAAQKLEENSQFKE